MKELALPQTLLPIEIAALYPDAPLEFDLYMRLGSRSETVLYRERHVPMDVAELRSLRDNGVSTLYIAAADSAAYERYVRKWTLSDRSIPSTDRYKIVSALSRPNFIQALQSDCPEQMVQNAKSLGEEIVNTIVDNDLVLHDLFTVMRHDYCTFTHASNVCSFSVTLSVALGMADRATLTAIAVGALLHDIGKRKTPLSILNKPGKLTPSEIEQIRKHPGDGFEELAGRDDLEWGQLMMVYQHHEQPDGGGYPVGIELDEIHPWAQICSVVDVFDALTSDRPYRVALPVGQTLDYLQYKAGTQFNSDLVRCWIQLMNPSR